MAAIDRLLQIMARLRDPQRGCPWDLEQTFATIAPYTIEEAYEVADAIEREDFAALRDELGDLLFQVVFHSRMAQEQGSFAFDDVATAISDKLERRHPHVFAGEAGGSADDVLKNWKVIKAAEAAEKAARNPNPAPTRQSLLDGIPSKLPALHETHQISSRVARVGFDWPEIDGIFEKLQEEVQELRAAILEKKQADIEDEMGDLFFVLVNIARVLKVDSESALKRANRKFKTRFQHMESEILRSGKTLDETPLNEMESLWKIAKKETKSQ